MPSYTYRKKRRAAVLRKMAAWRAAKERKRRVRGPVEQEPRMERHYPFEIGIRIKATGDYAWTELKSARFAHRLATVILGEFQP
jgi:hypothetical protein